MNYRNVRLGRALLMIGLLVDNWVMSPKSQDSLKFFKKNRGEVSPFKKSSDGGLKTRAVDAADMVSLKPRKNRSSRVDRDQLSPEQQFRKLQLEKIDSLYKKTQDDVIDAQQKVVAALKDKMDSLSGYSKTESEAFVKFLDDAVTGFRYQMQVEQTIMVADYFSFVKDNDPGYVYSSNLSQDERVFIEGISHIVQEAVVRVQALVLDLTAKNLSDRLSVELGHGFYDSALQAQRAYELQKEQNEQQLDRAWWDKLQSEGKQAISDFSNQFKKSVKKEVANQTQNTVNEIGGDIVAGAGGTVINFTKENISPVVAAQISKLGYFLKNKSLSFLLDDNLSIAVIALRKAIRMKYPISAPTKLIAVRTSGGLCIEEKEYLKQRMPKVQKVLKDAFDISEPLKIAFCCSGGGNRAMIGTLGLFMAASRHNFLQAALYSAGLSGSTWTIAPWSYLYLKGLVSKKNYEKSFNDFKNSLLLSLSDAAIPETPKKGIFFPPMLSSDVKPVFSNQIVNRFGYGQHISTVDLWAALIGNYSLKIAGDNRLQVCWSELYELAQKGDIPLPLCSAAFDARLDISDKNKQEVGGLYDWLETGPFEAGSTVLGYIPMKYFGCEFNNGQLVKQLMQHEYPMSFWLGVYGSAFSLTLNDIVEKGLPTPSIDVFGQNIKIPVDVWVKRIIDENYGVESRSKRIDQIHAQFPNFSVGLQGSLLKNKSKIGLFDGGIAFNIPLPLVIDRAERGVDIVIIYDSNPGDVQALKTADAYFKRKNISMPIMGNRSKADLLSRPMTVFNDPRDTKTYNSQQPTLIYFPTNLDVSKPPFTTANFKYTQDNFKTLVDFVDDAFESQVPDMKEILQKVAKARYRGVRSKPLAQ